MLAGMIDLTIQAKPLEVVYADSASDPAGNQFPRNTAFDLCRETAPGNFPRSDDGGNSYVFKQPTTPEEEALSKEAMEGCPVEAIGSNGEG
jgi:ferredoxin